jgi:hypothetical protein
MTKVKRFTRTVTMRPPGLIERLWFRRLRLQPPRAVSPGFRGEKWARLVPMGLVAFHRRYATAHGLHWGPCVLCTAPYGGHQHGGGVPDPTMPPPGPYGPWYYMGICPRCTRAGRGADL